MPMMDNEMPMDEESPAEDQAEGGEGSESESPSAFVGKDFFQNESPKIGDHPSIVVKDIDPETGEYELKCDIPYKDNGMSKGYGEDFDRAMPEESEA